MIGEYKKVYFDRVLKAPNNCINYFESFKNVSLMLEEIYNDSFIPFKLVKETHTEKIYFVNNEVYVYVGLLTADYTIPDYDYTIKERNPDGSFPEHLKKFIDLTNTFIVVCEMGFCSFKGVHISEFDKRNKMHQENTKGWTFSLPNRIFHNYPYDSKRILAFNEIVKRAIEICPNNDAEQIEEILDNFEGVPYAVAVYKIKNDKGQTAYAALSIDKLDRAHEFARKAYTDSLVYVDDFSKKPYKKDLIAKCPMNMFVSDAFVNIFKSIIFPNGVEIADRKEVFQSITYTITNVLDNPNPNIDELENYYLHHIGNIVEANYGGQYLAKKAVSSAENHELDSASFFAYYDGRTKWKSEYLVYQIVKKLYPNQTIYQYRPSFLKSEKGQMSYDIYISGLNIAIEYQGKQHFEAIDYFGGQSAFEENRRRDELKMRLSKSYNVKLIYINYNEDISEKLIIEKINSVKRNN